MLAKYGCNRVSIDEIASHCGFTKKTLYCYFDSKDALVASIIEKELLKEKEDFYEILSINLKFYRKKYNLSQEKFADILGTTLSYLNQIENNHVDVKSSTIDSYLEYIKNKVKTK